MLWSILDDNANGKGFLYHYLRILCNAQFSSAKLCNQWNYSVGLQKNKACEVCTSFKTNLFMLYRLRGAANTYTRRKLLCFTQNERLESSYQKMAPLYMSIEPAAISQQIDLCLKKKSLTWCAKRPLRAFRICVMNPTDTECALLLN